MELRLHDEFPDGLWYLSWYDPEEGDFGATLGECLTDGLGEPPTDRDDLEHYNALKTIREMFPNARRTGRGWAWETKKEAMIVWKAVNLANQRPLPEWAKAALQEGWKPPKGWKA